ncbi:MAG: hypothetical protein E7288_00780 [Lachnospiraceae bacterium]|nr:hypothetical protein [Lachnospiraceae bacterium]
MKRAAKILLIWAMGLELIFGILLIPTGILMIGLNGTAQYTTDGLVLSILIEGVKAIIPGLFKLVIIIALLVGLETNEKVIWPEILALVLFCGIMGIGSGMINSLTSSLLARFGGTEVLVTYSGISNGRAFIAFLHTISNSLLIMGACFGIAYKKLLLPIVPED